MSKNFNIFQWQIDPAYREEIKKKVQSDEHLADEILDMLLGIAEEIGLPFDFERPEPKPKVWVDKGKVGWNATTDNSWSTK